MMTLARKKPVARFVCQFTLRILNGKKRKMPRNVQPRRRLYQLKRAKTSQPSLYFSLSQRKILQLLLKWPATQHQQSHRPKRMSPCSSQSLRQVHHLPFFSLTQMITFLLNHQPPHMFPLKHTHSQPRSLWNSLGDMQGMGSQPTSKALGKHSSPSPSPTLQGIVGREHHETCLLVPGLQATAGDDRAIITIISGIDNAEEETTIMLLCLHCLLH
mmetsp:Transcript_9333/g.56890  ORF Transcript_9333/g.56890 Transcript_9333/m.56890 type:complete len:215 (-) Transcript_9333:678-1322(-)